MPKAFGWRVPLPWGEFWLLGSAWCLVAVVPIIKVKVSAPPRSSGSQAAAETQCWLQSHNVSLSPRPAPPAACLLGTNQPTPLPAAAAGTVLMLLCSTSVAKLLLRTFSAHSALGLETRPTEMECFLMTGSTQGREGGGFNSTGGEGERVLQH